VATDHLPTNRLPNVHPVQPVPTWPKFTELIQDDDGSYKQTGQITEINNCLGAAVKRANANIVLIGSFPNIDEQEQWLVDALTFELTSRSQSHVIEEVRERARVDVNYFHSLLSMVITDSVHILVTDNCPSDPKPLERLPPNCIERGEGSSRNAGEGEILRAGKVFLRTFRFQCRQGCSCSQTLGKRRFPFRQDEYGECTVCVDHEIETLACSTRVRQDTLDRSAPYQRWEIFVMLAHFFKGDDTVKSQIPAGDHGPQIPEAMVALAATLVSIVYHVRNDRQIIADALRLVD